MIARPSDLPASNHYHGHVKALLLQEYAYLEPGTTIDPARQPEIALMVSRALKILPTYMQVSKKRPIPWSLVAALDMRESGCDPMGCLANGDPWNEKTIHYPSGAGPWVSKTESCLWALDDFQSGWHQDLSRVKWSIPEMLYMAECFNGFNPRIDPGTVPADASGYIYSGALFEGRLLYEKGKRKEKRNCFGKMVGYFDPDQVDEQIGVLAFLKGLQAAGYNLFAAGN